MGLLSSYSDISSTNDSDKFLTLAQDGSTKLTSELQVGKHIAANGLRDANGNKVVEYGATASAVNDVKITNAATGNAPQIAANGTDTNINLKLKGKGNGVVDLAIPYKFSVYRSAAWTTGNNTFSKVSFDTKEFDTGSNYDATTNFKFTAPIAGFYQITWLISGSIGAGGLFTTGLYKNGTQVRSGSGSVSGAATSNFYSSGSTLIQLAANDTLEVYCFAAGGAGATGLNGTNFTGYLVSAT